MIDARKLTKRYYTITEVSKLFNVAKSLLRYWEGEFKEIRPRKDGGGTRRYTAKDIQKIDRIYQLLKVRGFTIDGAKNELSQKIGKEMSKDELKDTLESVLERLKEIRNKI